MKRITLSISTLLVAIFLSGCGQQQTTDNSAMPANTGQQSMQGAISQQNQNQFKSNIDATDWQLYTYKEAGFEFKYPNDIHIVPNDTKYPGFFMVGIENNDKDLNANIGVNIPYIDSTTGKKILSEEEISVSGLSGKFQTAEDTSNFAYKGTIRKWIRVFLVNNGNTYSLTFQFPKDGKDYSEVAKAIISTFKLNQ